MTVNMLTPMLALIIWTFVVWFALYATRLPAMRAAGIDAKRIKRKEDLDVLPLGAKQIADNYNHLHEQPTLFYALLVYTHLVGLADRTQPDACLDLCRATRGALIGAVHNQLRASEVRALRLWLTRTHGDCGARPACAARVIPSGAEDGAILQGQPCVLWVRIGVPMPVEEKPTNGEHVHVKRGPDLRYNREVPGGEQQCPIDPHHAKAGPFRPNSERSRPPLVRQF